MGYAAATYAPEPGTLQAMSRFLDALYVGALMLFILSGCFLVPFHGDESTIIYMSRDYDTLFRRGDLAHLLYRDPPPTDDPQAGTLQDLRLINGVVNKYWYGFMWSITGFGASDLNDQWLWGADLNFNRANGHVPTDQLLFVCRWASALLTGLSAAVVFVIGQRLGGRRTAYVVALIYTLTPSVLLNGRRAMMESGLLLFGALLVYVGQRAAGKRLNVGHIIALGMAAGLTVASKHTGVIVVVAVFGGVVLMNSPHPKSLSRGRGTSRPSRYIPTPPLPRERGLGGEGIFVASLLALTVFILLNPAWWSDPLRMPGRVLAARQALLSGQVKTFGGFASTPDRLVTLARESLSGAPQYFEDKTGWPEWIGDQVIRYEASGLAGLSGSIWTVISGVLLIVGAIRALRSWQSGSVFIVLIWAALTFITVYILTPLDWQRYYLPMAAPVALLCGMAFTTRSPRQVA